VPEQLCRPGVAPPTCPPLAALRQDLQHHPGPRDKSGAPSHVLHDPAADAYFHVGCIEFEMLTRWQMANAQAIADDICATSTFSTTSEEVAQFATQLRHSGLLRCRADEIAELRDAAKKHQADMASRFTNSLLFMRFPLLRPQKFLDRIAFLAAPFFTRPLWYGLLAGFLLALYLIGRQWDVFTASLANMANLNGAVAISIALALAKSVHELAHGLAARRYGADVPVMGIAFILFWPLLYTETSNAWTVASRRARVIIAAAGVAAELAFATCCFILWPLLDPGPFRDAAGFAATTLIVLSLLFNANPLMRFDGYFILSEIAGIENMQPRGFEIVKWYLRRLIAGVTLPYPEIILDTHERRVLLIYGIALMFYRIGLYSGIVYGINRLLFPAAALPLSLVIIMSSLLKPILGEVSKWFRLAYLCNGLSGIARPAAICAILAAPLFIPWRSSVQVPVLISAGDTYDIFTPEPARISSINFHEGDRVGFGAVLIKLRSPDVDFRLAQAMDKAQALDRSINQRLTDIDYHPQLRSSESELAKLKSEIRGLRARRRQLTITAPAAGTLTRLDRNLRPGLWVRATQPLMQLAASRTPSVFGYAEERDMEFIRPGARARIWIDGQPGQGLEGRVDALYPQALKTITEPLMASTTGGAIAIRPSRNELIPELAIYKTKIVLDDASAADMAMLKTRGYAKIETAPRNLISRIRDRVIGLWRRELG